MLATPPKPVEHPSTTHRTQCTLLTPMPPRVGGHSGQDILRPTEGVDFWRDGEEPELNSTQPRS